MTLLQDLECVSFTDSSLAYAVFVSELSFVAVDLFNSSAVLIHRPIMFNLLQKVVLVNKFNDLLLVRQHLSYENRPAVLVEPRLTVDTKRLLAATVVVKSIILLLGC